MLSLSHPSDVVMPACNPIAKRNSYRVESMTFEEAFLLYVEYLARATAGRWMWDVV